MPAGLRYIPRSTQESDLVAILKEDLPEFLERASGSDPQWSLPAFVERQLRATLGCGDFTRGFLKLQCQGCSEPRLVPYACKSRICPSCSGRRMSESAAFLVDRVLPKVPYRHWVLSLPWALARGIAFDSELCASVFAIFADVLRQMHQRRAQRRGITGSDTGVVLEIQRFADGARLYPHGHAICPDGVFSERDGQLRFHATGRPTLADVTWMAEEVSRKVHRLLERRRRAQEQDLADEHAHPARLLLEQCARSQELRRERDSSAPAVGTGAAPSRRAQALKANVDGIDIAAGLCTAAHERSRLERLCRYIARPCLSEQRIRILRDGNVAIDLKRAWKGGVTRVVFEPMAFIARLASLVPPPGFHLRRLYGVFAPNHRWRTALRPPLPSAESTDRPVAPERPKKMLWADLLKRVWLIDALECPRCGASMRLIAAIDDPNVIQAILAAAYSGQVDQPFRWKPDADSG